MASEPPTTLTEPQRRVLDFCVKTAGGKWVTFEEMDSIRLLDDDDVLAVPSLVERQLLEHRILLRAVRATEAGKVIANER